nr:endocuticle structural glycoprotein SgAbd-8-like [Penaeus vannamei]
MNSKLAPAKRSVSHQAKDKIHLLGTMANLNRTIRSFRNEVNSTVNYVKVVVLILILSLLLAVAERPSLSYDAPAPHTSSPVQQIPIICDERVHPAADGTYSFDVETGDGIVRNESGGPDGQVFDLQFVADLNGYQPQSSFLPVAPAFPHPIPTHALEQIERGRLELEARAREEQRQSSSPGQDAPPRHYGQPQ